ncbi:MAG: glucose 1-dehydrogenase [Gammaproteobacteria bacterium]|nr:glucose 1-dehydrogenase [Gammaproteobacteria bacterium]MDH3371872.1 glucose 1-dehydrogenase [Gammaproteobacteria bacterium]MDH3407799.1 glucose 1-dehydrogenase [Gammaproteobacteria bacterium]MDH3551146.1 glucose 1-dehydrogenase [Gammaproteobacteria bacterium]
MSIASKFRLDGHTALVTGAGRGIGKGIALAMAEAGADVVCASRTKKDVDTVAAAIRDLGQKSLAVSCDVASEAARQELVDTCVAELGGLSILVNNAGGAGPNDPLKTSAGDFEATLTWNVVPAFDLSRAALPHLKNANDGSIINISSMAARLRQRKFSAYGTAKAAVSHMTRLLAQDFAPDVRVNAIEPGPIATAALTKYMTPEMRDHIVAAIPLKRLGEVDDVSALAVFLASPAASWISGKVIELDGGTEAPW